MRNPSFPIKLLNTGGAPKRKTPNKLICLSSASPPNFNREAQNYFLS
ncbi:hypothetical protein RchiOBHm_Chr1g0336371 [Rosa chinensis]|uniref:Uncharacterized protein n=1 Tax=Rosa chinensis TaxID=74649 RepID=A0A2P6SCM5_ROSCH|nr:hypothetical protein RchiOBHm_Chr1g0336371 [Rosa chinensis]